MGQMRNQPDEIKDRAWDWLEDQVLADPEVGPIIKRALKKKDPRVNFPELAIEDTITAKTQEHEKKIDDFLESQKTKENKAFWEGQRKQAIDAGHVTEEERGDFEKWMIEENMGNYQRAAKMWHDEKSAAAEPTNYQDMTGVQLPTGKGLFENPNKWARDEGLAAVNEIRRQRNS
jgi:hypothetical protein